MNLSRLLAGVLFILIVICSACSDKPQIIGGRHYTGTIFGKPYTIDVVGDSTDYQPQFDAIIDNFQKLFDSNNPQSIISQFNNLAEGQRSLNFKDTSLVFPIVFDLAKDLNRRTMKYYDPTVMPLKREWMIARMAGISANLDSIYQFVGFEGIGVDMLEQQDSIFLRKSDKRIELDFTELAQAITLDHIADFLRGKGVLQFKITYERDVLTHGMEIDELNIIPMGVTSDSADLQIRLLQSAFTYSNVQDKISMIDPVHGYPVENEMAYVGVIAPTLAEAKIFSRAFMMMGIEKASEYYAANEDSKIHSYMFYKDGEILRNASTNGFDNCIVGTGLQQDANR